MAAGQSSWRPTLVRVNSLLRCLYVFGTHCRKQPLAMLAGRMTDKVYFCCSGLWKCDCEAIKKLHFSPEAQKYWCFYKPRTIRDQVRSRSPTALVFVFQSGLIVACYHGYVDVVIALSQCPYLDVNWQDNEGNTALITAAQAGKPSPSTCIFSLREFILLLV